MWHCTCISESRPYLPKMVSLRQSRTGGASEWSSDTDQSNTSRMKAICGWKIGFVDFSCHFDLRFHKVLSRHLGAKIGAS